MKQIGGVTFDDQRTIEGQDFIDQSAGVVAVVDDQGIDSHVKVFDLEVQRRTAT